MNAGSPGDAWDRLAAEVERNAGSDPVDPLDALVEPINGYVERFLQEVWARHGASLRELMNRSQRMTIGLDAKSDVSYEAGRGEEGRFTTSVLGYTFYIPLNGYWGFYVESSDDYLPDSLLLGYDEHGAFRSSDSQVLAPLRRMVPNQILEALLRQLVTCAMANW